MKRSGKNKYNFKYKFSRKFWFHIGQHQIQTQKMVLLIVLQSVHIVISKTCVLSLYTFVGTHNSVVVDQGS